MSKVPSFLFAALSLSLLFSTSVVAAPTSNPATTSSNQNVATQPPAQKVQVQVQVPAPAAMPEQQQQRSMQQNAARNPAPAAAVQAPAKPPLAPTAQQGAQPAGQQPTAPVNSPAAKAPVGTPFINNHYVLTGSLKVNGYHPGDPTMVIVDKGSHSTYILQLQNGQVTRVLTVSNAIGKEEKPTPPGRYYVLSKKQFPTWIPPRTIDKKQKPVPPYNETHRNPLGVAAIFLNKDELALHGTNDPKEIRQSASHGCVRHSNSDISKIYGMVHQGDTVLIIREFRGTVLNKSDFKSRTPDTGKQGKSKGGKASTGHGRSKHRGE